MKMTDNDIIQNFKIIQSQMNEINAKLNKIIENNKNDLEDAVLELAEIISEDSTDEDIESINEEDYYG